MKPFWRYYGGKWRAAPRYPKPAYDTIVEPFAGCAGYSTRYYDRKIILVEKFPTIAELWRYLIRVSASEIRSIPYVENVDDLPSWTPQPARDLVGWWMNAATTTPRKTLSAGRKRLAAMGCKFEGWTEATQQRIATQVEKIRHWKIIEGEWYEAPIDRATWYVDPPYANKAGSHYIHNSSGLDYEDLAFACREGMPGQVIVCENEGADWLPFVPFATLKAGVNGKGSREVMFYREDP